LVGRLALEHLHFGAKGRKFGRTRVFSGLWFWASGGRFGCVVQAEPEDSGGGSRQKQETDRTNMDISHKSGPFVFSIN